MFSPLPVCRPALPSDRADVLEFTKFIWDGHDYIKDVWDDWLADPRGLLAVVEYAGHAVALGKVTYVAEGQWWLEGLRVDPKLQGLKLGTRIFQYLDRWWQRHAGGAIRLMTAWDRLQVHHLCERFGWHKIGEVKAWEAPAAQGDHPFVPVPERDLPDALSFATAHLDSSWQLADVGWVFAAPDLPMLADRSRRGRLYRSLGPDFGSLDEIDSASTTSGGLPQSPAPNSPAGPDFGSLNEIDSALTTSGGLPKSPTGPDFGSLNETDSASTTSGRLPKSPAPNSPAEPDFGSLNETDSASTTSGGLPNSPAPNSPAGPDFGSLNETDSASTTSGGLPKSPAPNSPAIVGLWDEWYEQDADGQPALGISFIASPPDSLTAALSGLRRLAASLGFASVRWHAPFRADVEAALTAAGYKSLLPGSAFLFGKDA